MTAEPIFGGPVSGDLTDEDELVAPDTALDELRREVERDVSPEPVTIPTTGRVGWSVRFNTDIDTHQLNSWRRKSQDRRAPDGVDIGRLTTLVLAATCEAILYEGKVVVDEEHERITFNHAKFREWTNSVTVLAAVKHWYGSDGHVLATAEEVIRAAGYGSLVEPEDEDDHPTRR